MTLQYSHHLMAAAHDPLATHDAMWRAAAFDFLHACLTRQHQQIIDELADVFTRIDQRYQPL